MADNHSERKCQLKSSSPFPAFPLCLFWIVHDLIPEDVISMLAEVIMLVFDFDKPCIPDFLA